MKNGRWFIIIGNIKTNEVLAFEKTEIEDNRLDIIIMSPDIILIWGDKLYINETD